MPKPKARKCKTFDKYGVMRIICVLREKGVYEHRSDPQFDALLEQVPDPLVHICLQRLDYSMLYSFSLTFIQPSQI